MEEARQARAKTPEPRVPVVSRPTAARTQHMAEIAKALSTRHSCVSDDRGRVLCPAYPVSTLNAPVPRVLKEALEAGATRDEGGDIGGGSASWNGEEGGRGGDASYQRSVGSRKGTKSVRCRFVWFVNACTWEHGH